MPISLNFLLPLLLVSACYFTLVNSRKDCSAIRKLSNSKLICYYSTVDQIDGCHCTHVILPSDADVKSIERVRDRAKGTKVYVSVNEFNQGLINLLKSSKVDGLEINLKKLDSKNDISDFISTIKSKIGSDLDIALSVPSKADLVAKYFDFKALSKHTDLFILQTAFLGASTNVTFHPSRLSGLWDMQNTDSVVDLISGLGAPLSKLVIAAPVQAFQFTLQNEEYTAPGSPAVELKSITRDELCKSMHGGKNWTLERDEDQAGPYIFRKNEWIAFEDVKSIDIKAKYSRVRGLAGIALKDLVQDGGVECGATILEATYNGLSRQARAPRGAVLHSLEREILESPINPLDSVQLSPYRISRIIDTEGKIHITRQDSRTEFQCSRQGYFVHPRSCNRFYRCVKFDQRSDDFNVFEFDCPAGLAFDERVEVCVWPGSLPHGTPCSGSSEIAPVPRKRFECPSEPGYYADPENCRWFFACLDHGKSPLSAYEFRCPFGLGFDGARLVCEWPWLVPNCGEGHGTSGLYSEYYYGGATGNAGYAGQGALSSGLVLQTYDGLGTLGAIQLGGISGKIEKPIATVYSNVGTGALGLGYQNNGGYIVGGGLSYKAAQSLANAGLLKVNNGVGYQATGENQQGVIYTTNLDNSNANVHYTSGYPAETGHLGNPDAVSSHSFTQYGGQSGAGNGAFLINVNGDYDSGANAYAAGHLEASGNLQYQGESGQYQGSNLHLDQGSLGGTGYVGTQTGVSGSIPQDSAQYFAANQQSGLNIASGHYQDQSNIEGQQGGSYVYQSANLGAHSAINNGYDATRQGIQVTGYVGSDLGKQDGAYISVSGSNAQGSSGSYATNKNYFNSQYANVDGKYQDNSGGAVSTQSFIQYHGLQGNKGSENYDSGVNGNVNIVGGGYSAVGTLAGVQVSNNGDVDDIKTVSLSSTPSPISVTTYAPASRVSSVPTVTAVPVPGIKTATSFETFRGGVIANVPELQYKVKSYGDASFLANTSSSFANFVVTTPATVAKEVIQQTYSQSGGYIYNKPERGFEEGSLNSIPISTARPFVTVNTEEPKVYFSSTIKPLLNQQEYVYEKPGVALEENHVVYSTPKPIVSTVNYQKYDDNGGYIYKKPLVAFEEKPQNVLVDTYSSLVTPKPTVYVSDQPKIYISSTTPAPALPTYSFTQEVNQKQGGYYYRKPSVIFEERPQNPTIISKFTIRKPVLQQQPVILNQIPTVQLKQKTVLENYAYQQPAQPAVVSQFYYQQPSIKQQPIVPLYKQPELLATYTYQPPVQKTIYKQPVSTYTYQNVAQEAVGVTNAQQQVSLVQKPIQTYSYQPSGGTSYQYIKFENDLQEKPVAVQSQGYNYPKPTVAFEEQPQLELKKIEGYVHEKPAVTFEATPVTYSTPKPIIAVQPAVVTSYFNTGSLKSEQAAVEQENIGYSYPQPAVKFEEVPIVHSTPKPFVPAQSVTPAVVTNYFNIDSSGSKQATAERQHVGYSYPQPAVKFEEAAVVYSTPKPFVQPVTPAVVTSYFNIQNSTPKPVAVVQPAVVTSAFNVGSSGAQHAIVEQEHVGYSYPQPAVKFEEAAVAHSTPKPFVPVQPVTPAVVTSYFNIQSSTPKPVAVVQPAVVAGAFNVGSSGAQHAIVEQEHVGYNYPQPAVKFEEAPVVHSTPKPFVPAQPVVTSYFNIQSSTPKPDIDFHEPVIYSTPKPIAIQPLSAIQKVQFVDNPAQPAVISSYNFIGSTTPQPNIVIKEQEPQIVVEQKPAVVTSYFHQQPSQPVVSQGYDYPKPSVQFVKEPQSIVSSYDERVPVQEVPFVKKTAYVTGHYQENAIDNYNYEQNFQGNSQQTGKVVVENYVHPNYEKIKQAVFGQKLYHQQEEVGYQQPQVLLNYIHSTPKPTFVSTIKTIARKKLQPVTPATVTFYDSRYISTPESYVSSTVAPEIKIVSTTSRPISKYSFSSLDDQYQYNQYQNADKSRGSESTGYSYFGSTTPQPNIIIEEQRPLSTPKPQVIVEHQPAVVNSYFHQQPSQPVVFKGYEYPKPSVQFVEEPQSVISSYDYKEPVQEVPFVKKTAYVTGQYQQNAQENYNYQENLQGNYQQTGKVVVENYVHPNYEKVKQALFGYQEQELEYQQPQIAVNYIQSTPKPTFVSTVEAIASKNLQPVTPATVTFYDSRFTSTPESYISSTIAPEIKIISTTSRPISKFSFSSDDNQYQYNQYLNLVKSTTPEPTRIYLPVTSRVRVTSALPKITTTKVVDEYVVPEVTTLTRDYLPAKIRIKAPAKEYLPVEVTTPSREYLPSRQRVKVIGTTAAPEVTTLFREYLPVKSRVKVTTAAVRPTTIIKQNDAHPLLSAKLGAQCTCVSNSLRLRKKQKIIVVEDDDNDDDGYIVDDGSRGNYESQRVVDITPTPEVYVHSTSVAPQVYLKKRVKVRPVLKQTYLPVTQASDIFYKNDDNIGDSEASDQEIAKAVRTGLKLVKQAAKEGAREGTQEALSGQHFDRYGPGGVRSRSETLQGTIDCQRAGLFRHPTECNKFYACRWDCTKNRFTLHVFNCPVHLTFDNTLGACNWPSQGPACVENTLITSD